ncbi:unnamed protein product [Clonostachys byssicola]|uniref:Uncharacterized protein n=1 Tax=Clonostachys byssicola TaxID=160290 RepID=A0A9N9XTQ5_9HYPO|nr:unnamed protein product [Clonostachys byssicola]
MVNRGPMRPYGAGGAIEMCFRFQLPRPMMGTAADRVGRQLVGLYESEQTSIFAGPSYLEFCPQRLSQSSCLVDCVAIYCASWVRANRGQSVKDVLGSRLFKNAIRSLQIATNSNEAYTPETLASMVIFARLLNFTGEYEHSQLRDHHFGIRHVAQQLGLPGQGDLLHTRLISETASSMPITGGVTANVKESPWKEQRPLGDSPFWDKDRGEGEEEEEEETEVDWDTIDEAYAGYNDEDPEDDDMVDDDIADDMDEAFTAAESNFEEVQAYLERIWLPELLEIWTNPLGREEKTISLLKIIAKAERLFGKSLKEAWTGCLSIGKFQDPNFFLGHSYSFSDYQFTGMFLIMLTYQSFLVRILYEFSQLLGVRDAALYDKYRGLCVRIWACAPSLSNLDPISNVGTFKLMLPSFEIATDEELRHILDLNIELIGHGRTGNVDIPTLRPIIIQVGEKFTGRQEFKPA